MYSEGPIQFFSTRTPRPNRESVQGYAAWIALQAVLYICLPGPIVYGPTTPGGRNLEYKLNGLAAWAATVLLAVLAAFLGLLDPAALAKNWGALVSTSNIFSVVVAIVFQIKARLAPDNKKETFFTGL
jgi:7-dehydrocholesterol reductase